MNDIKHDIKKRHKNLTEFRYIAVGFFLTILSGAIMLSLPFSSRDGQWTNFLDSLFTATSATCVTGLVVFDTFRHWSIIGQLVILVLIQIGGMGFISIGVAFSMLLHKKIGLRQRDLMQESVNALEIGGIVRLFSVIIRGTFLIEGIGAVFLAIRFIPDFGILRGIYFSVFHSISAFCNAGFDLMGINEEYSSFTKYAADPLVNITIMLLIIIGGIGFTIWNEVRIKKFKLSRYSLHAKIVISTTLILVFGGGLFMYIFEKNNTIAGMDTPGAIFASLFGSVTARTAGFNTVDTAALTQESKLLTIVLMFIGGSPGSTAGGMKTTTFSVLILNAIATFRSQENAGAFGRRLEYNVIKNAATIAMMYFILFFAGGMTISVYEGLPLSSCLFEAASAVGTVGLTLGITPKLHILSQIILIILMYLGRVGGLTLIYAVFSDKNKRKAKLPLDKIIVG